MTASPLVLLDDWSKPGWWLEVAERLRSAPGDWIRSVEDEGLDTDRAWVLLGWVEDAASALVSTARADLLHAACFAISLLETGPLDRRDVMVVAMLLRRAAVQTGLDFGAAVRAGCAAAGDFGTRCAEWLSGVSDALPTTHEQVGTGRGARFRRLPSTIDTDELLRRFGRPDS